MRRLAGLIVALLAPAACASTNGESGASATTAADSDASGSSDSSGDGDTSETGDDDGTTAGDGTTGDGDGDGTTTSGDGDGTTSGDGDGTMTSGDGDGTTGDGDGDGSALWQPTPGTTWQWQLQGTIDTSFDVAMYDIDLFDVPTATIDGLHQDGRVVICYFSAGSYEDWRPDEADFPSASIGNPLGGWPGEAWLDHRDPAVRAVIAARLDLAVQKNCDGVEPDNVDGYTNNPGFSLTAVDQLDYNRWLATEAHARGLSIGLKNDLDQVAALEPDFDWALNEECQSYSECDVLQPFLDANKAVFHVEYVDNPGQMAAAAATVCPAANAMGFSSWVKTWDLDTNGVPC